MKILWIFLGGQDKIWLVLGVSSMYVRVFSKGKFTEWEYFCVAKNSNIFWGAWYFRYFWAANGRCWAQSYVWRKSESTPPPPPPPHTHTHTPHTHSPWVTVYNEKLLARWSVMADWGNFWRFYRGCYLLITHVLNLNICWSMLYESSAFSIFLSSY